MKPALAEAARRRYQDLLTPFGHQLRVDSSHNYALYYIERSINKNATRDGAGSEKDAAN